MAEVFDEHEPQQHLIRMKISRLLRNIAAFLADNGLTYDQLHALSAVERYGHYGIGSAAEHLKWSVSKFNTALAPILEKNLVRKEQDKHTRRITVFVTDRGKKLLQRASVKMG
jgi:DNA-binding MarR family transcriptional regulator